MWTIEKITALCIEYCGRCGVEFNSPVIINPRTVRTLGACYFRETIVNGKRCCVPTKIEFSQKFLSVASDKEIEDTVAHECAHYVTTAITHKQHGHDETFRYYCLLMGATDNTAKAFKASYHEHNDKVYKYSFFCKECGQFVGGKTRACKMTRFPELFRSGCCHGELKMVQNW